MSEVTLAPARVRPAGSTRNRKEPDTHPHFSDRASPADRSSPAPSCSRSCPRAGPPSRSAYPVAGGAVVPSSAICRSSTRTAPRALGDTETPDPRSIASGPTGDHPTRWTPATPSRTPNFFDEVDSPQWHGGSGRTRRGASPDMDVVATGCGMGGRVVGGRRRAG